MKSDHIEYIEVVLDQTWVNEEDKRKLNLMKDNHHVKSLGTGGR